MPRAPLIRTSDFPYHVTIRSNNKDWFDLSMEEMWEIAMKAMAKYIPKYEVEIQAFVLMNNHYHLLIFTPNSDLDKFMHSFNSYISKRIREKTGRINRVFGDRYKWSLIQNNHYYWNVIRYIFQNPLRAGLVKKCEAYPLSSLRFHLFGKPLPFDPVEEFLSESFLHFLNEPIAEEEKRNIKQALNSVGEFQIPNFHASQSVPGTT